MLVLNAISLNMIPANAQTGRLVWHRMTLEQARTAIAYAANDRDIQSAVGHADTAAVFSAILGVQINADRRTVVFGVPGAYCALVGQYTGPRLPEGATSLPEGARIDWFWLEFKEGKEPADMDVVRKEVADQWRLQVDDLSRQVKEMREERERQQEEARLRVERQQSSEEWLSRREGQ